MANFTVSPGVSLNEIDQTFLTAEPIQAGAAIIGPAVKGPILHPIKVTSYSEYTTMFGDIIESGSQNYSYLTSIAAYNYFNNGGESLLVTRVASGSFTSATSNIGSAIESGVISTETDALLTSLASVTGSAGTYTISGSSSGTGTAFTGSITLTDGTTVSTITATNGGSGYAVGEIITIPSQSLGYGAGTAGTNMTITLNADDIVNTTSFTLETISEGTIMNTGTSGTGGALTTGTQDNVRWEVTSANTSSGTFSLSIRRGDDITNKKIILESFNNLSLDPNSSRYVAKVIGDQKLSYDSVNNQMSTTGEYPNNSRFVRVKSINLPTPNYLDANGTPVTSFTSSIPIPGNGTFSGATGTPFIGQAANFYSNINSTDSQGLIGANYNNAISLLSNTDDYMFNVLFTPGLTDESHTAQITSIITNTQNRGDNIFVYDNVNYGSTVTQAVNQVSARDTSYAATYWPWVRILDPATGKLVFVPASTVIPGVYAFNDRTAAPWFAPAGINRGGLNTVQSAEYKLTAANKDTLYEANINPIATLPREGVVVFGQKTLQKEASALDRVNVRRLLIALKSFIGQLADQIVFEQNTATTRNAFLARVTPYLEGVQQKQGLFAFKVVMDDSNNGPDVIDRNQLIGQIFIQPTRTAEFISLDFILLPTGAEFPA